MASYDFVLWTLQQRRRKPGHKRPTPAPRHAARQLDGGHVMTLCGSIDSLVRTPHPYKTASKWTTDVTCATCARVLRGPKRGRSWENRR